MSQEEEAQHHAVPIYFLEKMSYITLPLATANALPEHALSESNGGKTMDLTPRKQGKAFLGAIENIAPPHSPACFIILHHTIT